MDVQEWLANTSANDIMVHEVRVLRPSDSLAIAAGRLLREQMSGAPVVDDQGICVGILSASDIVGAEEKVDAARQKEAQSSFWHFPQVSMRRDWPRSEIRSDRRPNSP